MAFYRIASVLSFLNTFRLSHMILYYPYLNLDDEDAGLHVCSLNKPAEKQLVRGHCKYQEPEVICK